MGFGIVTVLGLISGIIEMLKVYVPSSKQETIIPLFVLLYAIMESLPLTTDMVDKSMSPPKIVTKVEPKLSEMNEIVLTGVISILILFTLMLINPVTDL